MILIGHVFACIVTFAVHIFFLSRNLEIIEQLVTELEPLK